MPYILLRQTGRTFYNNHGINISHVYGEKMYLSTPKKSSLQREHQAD
jgi:hypothetical protein